VAFVALATERGDGRVGRQTVAHVEHFGTFAPGAGVALAQLAAQLHHGCHALAVLAVRTLEGPAVAEQLAVVAGRVLAADATLHRVDQQQEGNADNDRMAQHRH